MDDSRDLPTPRDWLPQVVDRLTPRTALALLISLDPSADGQVTEEEAPAAVLCALQAAEDHKTGSGLKMAELARDEQKRRERRERESGSTRCSSRGCSSAGGVGEVGDAAPEVTP